MGQKGRNVMKEETAQYAFRLPVKLRKAVEQEAIRNERTLSQQIIFELRKNHPEGNVGV